MKRNLFATKRISKLRLTRVTELTRFCVVQGENLLEREDGARAMTADGVS